MREAPKIVRVVRVASDRERDWRVKNRERDDPSSDNRRGGDGESKEMQ